MLGKPSIPLKTYYHHHHHNNNNNYHYFNYYYYYYNTTSSIAPYLTAEIHKLLYFC